jgi:hypothetical protein
MNPKIRTVLQAADLMRAGGTLQKMHGNSGLRWYVVPGGEITENVASALLARPDVQPANDGLFPGISQTFRLRSRS